MSILTKYFPFRGGLNTTAPPLSITPGEIVDCLNYECLQEGGYQRILGYSLFDGKEEPDSVIPGVGPVLGVHIYRGEVYAIRDTATEGRLYKATSTGWVEVDNAFTFSLGGDYSFANYNFFGQDDQEEMFIVNGKDKAVKYDGTTLVQLTTGLTEDTPNLVMGFRKHLVLGVQSSIMISSVGDPTNWDAATGSAAEIAVGDTVNDLEVSQGALIIGCRNSTQVLYGNDSSDFRLEQLNSTGTFRHTLQNIGGQMIGLDASGVMNLQATSAFGNFVYGSLSERVRNIASQLIEQGNHRTVLSRNKGQYRLFSGVDGLFFTLSGQQLVGISKVTFNHPVLCVTNGNTLDGFEMSYFGTDDGYVFKMESGYRFHDQPIPSVVQFAFHTFGLPTQRKRFRQVSLDVRMEGDSGTMYLQPFTNFGAGAGGGQDISSQMAGGSRWGIANWDAFFWDGADTSIVKARVNATGQNLGTLITSDSDAEGTHILYGATIHYSPRRLNR